MPTLYLLRHAKSSWDDPSLGDHDRPLARRGVKACGRLHRYVEEAGIAPEVVLCSTAVRARETLARVFPDRDDGVFEAALYHTSGGGIIERLHTLEAESAMVIGHNPALQDALLLLARPSPLRDRVAEQLPTGALATLEPDSWDASSADLVALVFPRDL